MRSQLSCINIRPNAACVHSALHPRCTDVYEYAVVMTQKRRSGRNDSKSGQLPHQEKSHASLVGKEFWWFYCSRRIQDTEGEII